MLGIPIFVSSSRQLYLLFDVIGLKACLAAILYRIHDQSICLPCFQLHSHLGIIYHSANTIIQLDAILISFLQESTILICSLQL
jgi:hypothetical protein